MQRGALNKPLVVSTETARMTNYYKTKLEGKVEKMVQSSLASSAMSGRPVLTPLKEISRKDLDELGLDASFHYKKLDVLKDMLNLHDSES